MSTVIDRLDEDPRHALGSYIQRLERDYATWYDLASRKAYYLWLTSWWSAVLAGFFTTVIGILIDNEILTGPWANASRLILPAVGSLAAVLLGRFIETKVLRERGRQAIVRMIAEARSAYASLGTNNEGLKKYLDDLVKRVAELEQDQLAGFVRSAATPSQ